MNGGHVVYVTGKKFPSGLSYVLFVLDLADPSGSRMYRQPCDPSRLVAWILHNRLQASSRCLCFRVAVTWRPLGVSVVSRYLPLALFCWPWPQLGCSVRFNSLVIVSRLTSVHLGGLCTTVRCMYLGHLGLWLVVGCVAFRCFLSFACLGVL